MSGYKAWLSPECVFKIDGSGNVSVERQNHITRDWEPVNFGSGSGVPGPQGEPGTPGAPGADGAAGEIGPAGPAGPEGQAGPKGDKGDTGEQGLQGSQGLQGEQGSQGVKGDTGDAGAAGQQGIQGIPGEQGPQGPQGDAGIQGLDGPQGPEGPEGPPGADGQGVTADQTAALAGTTGTPSATNKYVTHEDTRNSDARTPVGHTHLSADVTGLNAALGARQLTSEKGQANGYASLGADGKVPSAQLPASGSDPWTYVQVNGGSDFTTSLATAQDATGLAFTPEANTTYEFEALLMIRTGTATVNPRVGLAWASGGVDGVAIVEQSGATANAANANAVGNINAALLIAVGGLANTTQSWPVKVHGTFRAGAGPSGAIRIQLASETAGTTVRIVARSFLKYRTLAF